MQRYANLAGDSGVEAFECGARWIKVWFVGGKSYRYTYQSAGMAHVDAMKRLAVTGKGLSGYISREVKDGYEDEVG